MADTSSPSNAGGNGISSRTTSHEGAGHLDAELLRQYRQHLLTAEEEERVGRHLLDCAECRELAVDVSAFFDPPEEGEEEEADSKASWERLLPKFRAQVRAGGVPAPPEPAPGKTWLSAAAALAAVGVAGYLWLFVGSGSMKTLMAFDTTRGIDPPAPEVVHLPVMLQLRSTEDPAETTYRVELLGEGERPLLSRSGLHQDEPLRIKLRLWRFALKPGSYRLRLYRQEPGTERAERLIGSYAMQVR